MASLPVTSTAAIVLGAILVIGGPAAAQRAPSPPAEAPTGKPPAVKPSESPAETADKDLVGLDVFSSDGTRVGEVRAAKTSPGGDIVQLHVRTGGFLGFGGRTVAIPQGRFTRTGRTVRLNLDSDQVNGLPEVKE